ncbi:hypothetical protein HDU89_003666 [Geranomyces variabilis]|nr:hypothetical protein HDU89_003666 [Geranomyces variabilis]
MSINVELYAMGLGSLNDVCCVLCLCKVAKQFTVLDAPSRKPNNTLAANRLYYIMRASLPQIPVVNRIRVLSFVKRLWFAQTLAYFLNHRFQWVPAAGARSAHPHTDSVVIIIKGRQVQTTKFGRYLKNGSMNITVIPEQFFLGMSSGNSELDLEDFTKYDYIGAAPPGETWMNGGLSMRKRSTMLKITRTVPFIKNHDEEDVWFSHAVAAFPGAVIPSSETANTFSVGNVFSDRPFAMHKPRNAHGGIGDAGMKALFEWCE